MESPGVTLTAFALRHRTRNDEHSKSKENRFDRTASKISKVDTPCILTINGVRYNMTAWANAHPGGASVLKKFHGRDATKAFKAIGHSENAYAMLKEFEIPSQSAESRTSAYDSASTPSIDRTRSLLWRKKLFTKEDPRGIHKTLGVFSLLHFAYRLTRSIFFDPTAGFGSRMGQGASIVAAACLVPHAFLSLSSLIFHTVPRERVVGRPMIWQEFRAHNIVFGIRSVVCAALAWLSIYQGHAPFWRKLAVVGSSASILLSNALADEFTKRLCPNNFESTTATMPYWEGCSFETQRRFKSFYAYSQFMATLACLAVGNPLWPFSVLLAIQGASLLMTLVRKGILSARGYHIGYTATLVIPYVIGVRHLCYMKTLDFPLLLSVATIMYQLRKCGVGKYALWVPVVATRIAGGDQVLNWKIW